MKPYFLLFLLLSTLPAMAAELAMKPGLWETTTTRTSTMGGGAVTQTERQCIKHQNFDPRTIMQDMESCKLVTNELQNKNTLLFNMMCSMQGAKASLEGKFFTKDDEANGDMKVQVDMGVMNMQMDITWDSKRMGDC